MTCLRFLKKTKNIRLVEIFQKIVQQIKEAINFVKVKLKAKLAILWFFFENKAPLAAKTLLKLGNYVKKKTKTLKSNVTDVLKITSNRGELLLMIFASNWLYATMFCFLLALLSFPFNPNMQFYIFVFNVLFLFVYFIYLQPYGIYKTLKCLKQKYEIGANSKTEFNVESLKNKLKTTKKTILFFLEKLFIALLICFLFFLKRHAAFFEFITEICSYFAIGLYAIVIPSLIILIFFSKFDFYFLVQGDDEIAIFFSMCCLHYFIIRMYIFYKGIYEIFKLLCHIGYNIIFVLYYIKEDFDLNGLRKTIRRELKPIKSKIRKDLYFYFTFLTSDLVKIFFFFFKKWLLESYLTIEYFVGYMLFVLVLLSFFNLFFSILIDYPLFF